MRVVLTMSRFLGILLCMTVRQCPLTLLREVMSVLSSGRMVPLR